MNSGLFSNAVRYFQARRQAPGPMMAHGAARLNAGPFNTRIIGCLFLLAFVLYGVGNGLITSHVDKPESLTTYSENQLSVRVGFALVVMNSIAVMVIAALLFPILERWSRPAAIGYLSARILEAFLLLTGVMGMVSVAEAADTYRESVTTPPIHYEAILAVAKSASIWAYQTAMLILGLGSLGFCCVLFRSRLVPQTLAVLGLAGYILLAVGTLCEFFGLRVGLVLSIPGGLFELGFALWMIGKKSPVGA